jgi:adenylylsulfate kinase-like enzyme
MIDVAVHLFLMVITCVLDCALIFVLANKIRVENIRRVGEMDKLLIEAGVIVLTAFNSPYLTERERVRAPGCARGFHRDYCHCPVNVCEQRDV